MSPVPVDPFPDFVNGATVADGDQVDARFKALYDALNPAQAGIDSANIKDGGIATIDLADGAVTKAKLAPQEAWLAIALAAGLTLQYLKDVQGWVHLRGTLMGAAANLAGAGAGLGTLPPGYRPGTTEYVLTNGISGGVPGNWSIETNGIIRAVDGFANGASIVMIGCSFYAEN